MRMRAKEHQRFLHIWVATLLATLFTAALFNFLVDPYGLFDSPRWKGFNQVKPLAPSHVRLTKPYRVLAHAPHTLIAGNSRPEIGIDPANTCWDPQQRPVYNLSLPGSSVYMQARNIQHAVSKGNVEQVYWGLDFLDFLGVWGERGYRNPWENTHNRREFETRLRINADGEPNLDHTRTKLADHLKSLVSLTTLKDSIATVLAQDQPNSADIRSDGFNPARDYLDIIRWEGQSVLFKQKNANLYENFSRPGLDIYAGENHWSPQFESVKRLLEFAREYGVQVTLFINPYHRDYLQIIDETGHDRHFQEWKQSLADLAGQYEVRLWDFSLDNTFTSEAVPEAGQKKRMMRWFWEPAHYRKEYGDLMLSLMLKRNCTKMPAAPEIGERLTGK